MSVFLDNKHEVEFLFKERGKGIEQEEVST
jgi:hypothetical protein